MFLWSLSWAVTLRPLWLCALCTPGRSITKIQYHDPQPCHIQDMAHFCGLCVSYAMSKTPAVLSLDLSAACAMGGGHLGSGSRRREVDVKYRGCWLGASRLFTVSAAAATSSHTPDTGVGRNSSNCRGRYSVGGGGSTVSEPSHVSGGQWQISLLIMTLCLLNHAVNSHTIPHDAPGMGAHCIAGSHIG